MIVKRFILIDHYDLKRDFQIVVVMHNYNKKMGCFLTLFIDNVMSRRPMTFDYSLFNSHACIYAAIFCAIYFL